MSRTRRIRIATHPVALAALVLLGLLVPGAWHTAAGDAGGDASGPLPAWLHQEMTRLAEGSGTWLADNRQFQSAEEKFDHYGLEWKWGLGKQSLKGRLYGVIDGTETGTFWEYRLFWHPGEGQAILQQFGSDGTYGVGELKADDQGRTTMEQTFYGPDGSTWRTGHESWWDGEAHLTQQLEWRNGEWIKDRLYRWTRAS